MDLHGGCAPKAELDALDGEKLIRELIATGTGIITPYGVIFDNGLRIAPEDTGQNFPTYYDKQYLMELKLTPLPFAEKKPPMTLLLPTSEKRMERLLERGGYPSVEDVQISVNQSELPDAINERMGPGNGLLALNDMCQIIERLKSFDLNCLVSAIQMACPMSASQVRHLADNLDFFEFIPNVKTPEELGRFMIQESGHFEYDPNLEGFYDYAKYGEQRALVQNGKFNELGYIVYTGTLSLDELMMEDPAEQEQGQTMGGMI